MKYCKYKTPINILTPIHIGSTDTFNANEYLFLKNKLYRINIINFFNSLNNKNKEKFIKRIQDENFALSDLKYVDVDVLKSFLRYDLINKCSRYPKYNNIQIECGIKSQNKLYIPGSSIKGSIKTALSYNLIQLDQIPKIMNDILLNNYYRSVNDYFTSYNEELDIVYNILRFLQIEDSSNFNNSPHLHELVLWDADINQKKLIPKRRWGTRYLETIPESNTLQTEISIYHDKDLFQELNFDEDMEEFLNINYISKSLFSFAKDIIKFEIKFFSEFHWNNLVNFYEMLLDYNDDKKPLILLGSSLGMHVKTIYLKIYEYDKKNNTHFSENFIQLLFKRNGELPFPKSRNLTFSNFMPLGWAQLDLSNYL